MATSRVSGPMGNLPPSPVDDQVEDLRERMRLLQGDRRANIDILEANKNSNRDEIKRMRHENKELRLKLNQMQKGQQLKGDDNEVEHYQRQVDNLRREADQLRVDSSQLKKNLEGLKDQIKELDLEGKRPAHEDSPLSRKIRMLENRLDKAMIKYNEAQSIRKTYEQIVKRLKEERIGFDNQLAALERTLQAKHHDYEELLLLSGDASHAREVGQQELGRVKGGYEEERARREMELRERHQVVQLRKQMQDRVVNREKKRLETIAQAAGDLDAEGEKNLKKALIINNLTSSKFASEKVISKTKLDIFENAFRKIKEATGVSDVNEVIQKIINQEGTTENLMMLTKENQQKLEALNEHTKSLKSRVEEIKYSGPGGAHRRKMVDEYEEQLATSSTRLERSKLKYERLTKLLISVKAGIEHLQDKLECVRDELNGQSIQMTDETVVHVLGESEKMLTILQQRIKAMEYERRVIFQQEFKPSDDTAEEEVQQSRPYNQRIELPSTFDDEGEAQLADEGMPDVDEDELTRDKVKKAANQVILQQERKKKPKKKMTTPKA